MRGWIGVDLDGTLAEYHGWQGRDHIGEPVPEMLERVKRWRAMGLDVRIFTARICEPEALEPIQEWCKKHLGEILIVTNVKDYGMHELWDDRAVAIEPNTGKMLSASRRGLS